jgi:hypothetical protein
MRVRLEDGEEEVCRPPVVEGGFALLGCPPRLVRDHPTRELLAWDHPTARAALAGCLTPPATGEGRLG